MDWHMYRSKCYFGGRIFTAHEITGFSNIALLKCNENDCVTPNVMVQHVCTMAHSRKSMCGVICDWWKTTTTRERLHRNAILSARMQEVEKCILKWIGLVIKCFPGIKILLWSWWSYVGQTDPILYGSVVCGIWTYADIQLCSQNIHPTTELRTECGNLRKSDARIIHQSDIWKHF
jgi:hypothetical protein